ncbi:helix-turn-helix domain-containing protein [Gracilibacillus alcaliphilus]|uniref:helix-turn-helix domain-containing protein n=1 Tax=Gracilibacillus alcaliphilus TaxID=1401441 RepID=UPI00195A5064|nr:helix-turn-helix domain-containing protein [Gracilibacillus alcaliphilus]MBM7679591.1 transcriptional regulator with XRE-family HTH domain [Gracilibacillus alcaliphilus]
MSTFGERLRDIREEAGYEKQEDVAKLLNMSTTGYGYYETGKREPSLNTLKKIADILEVSTDYLLERIDTPHLPISYPVTNEISLSEEELLIVKEMQKSLFNKISDHPEENVKRIEQFWDFIENENK